MNLASFPWFLAKEKANMESSMNDIAQGCDFVHILYS